jgi:hypothetical protein
VQRIDGVDYYEAPAFFSRYGLSTSWMTADRRLLVQGGKTRIVL